jgi:hypothetical protein
MKESVEEGGGKTSLAGEKEIKMMTASCVGIATHTHTHTNARTRAYTHKECFS